MLTAAQTNAFFMNLDQMGIPAATVEQLRVEGIASVDDLADFDKETLKQVAENLRRPPGRVPATLDDPDGPTIPTPAFTFGAKSQKRLTVACDLIKYYVTVGRDITPNNIRWNPVMSNFEIQWKALVDRKTNDDDAEVPKVTKLLSIIKWTEAFQDFLSKSIGTRTIPLAYVTRPDSNVSPNIPPLAQGQPHSETFDSIEGELVARASHTHPLFREDNSKVYYFIEEATRSTQYAASIKPYQRTKDGRGAYLAILGQFAGTDKWEAEIKRQEQLIHTRIWKGQSNFTLEAFVAQHRNAFVSMQQCADHVQYQLPNEHSRVGLLIDAIACSDAPLQAALASVRTDNRPDGMRNNFELAAAHLLPYDPVAKRRSTMRGDKRESTYISAITATDNAATVGSVNTKVSIGRTGVHLRFHKQDEYKRLTVPQKQELYEWRQQQGPQSKRPRPSTPSKAKSVRRQISSAVTDQLARMHTYGPASSTPPTTNEQSIEAFIHAAIAKAVQQNRSNNHMDH